VPIQKYLFFVALAGEDIVGLGELDPAPPAVDVEGDAEVRGLYFAKAACGRGWGAAMMEHLEALARGYGSRTVRVDGTLNAKPFYERMGYEERLRRTYRFPSGVEVPSVRMVKTFSA
jgi:ribosomal protein S18 acetylase RimI-like enzyme